MGDQRIEGVVTDNDQTPLPGVILTLTDESDSRELTEVSREDGKFYFNRLSPGIYELKAEMEGFKTSNQKIQLGTEQALKINVVLQLGEVE